MYQKFGFKFFYLYISGVSLSIILIMKQTYFKTRKKRAVLILVLISASTLLITSCSKEKLPSPESEPAETSSLLTKSVTQMEEVSVPDQQIVLGDTVSNIFTVAKMRAAYTAIYGQQGGPLSGPSGIQTTHYSVRFLPANEDEWYSILPFDISEIPFDREIASGGLYYNDIDF